MKVISACLCGINCKYSGGNNFNEKAYKLFTEGKAILICPEQLGGLTTPRISAEITIGTARDILLNKGVVSNREGNDVTEYFLRGAKESLVIAKAAGCKTAILKARSPSCGTKKIYDGTFSGKLIEGNGVTAELFLQNGISILSEEDL